MFKKLRKLDYWIAVPFAILSMLGIVMVFSATQGTTAAFSNFIKQGIFVIIGLFGALLLYHFNLKNLQKDSWMRNIQFGVLGALFVAKFVMPPVNGAHGWINLGLITLQPAEFLKLAIILYFANIFTRYPWQSHVRLALQPISRMTIWWLPIASLLMVFIMPDNGNGLITLLILLAMFLASGVSRRFIAMVSAIMGLGFGFLQTVIGLANHFFNLNSSNHYAIARLTSFVNPWDPNAVDTSRQLLYGYYAIAHGGLFGVGLGNSLIKPYLPESNTDFIMAVMTEELGAVTTVTVLILMMILVSRMVILGIRQKHQYLRLLLFGIATLLFIQALVNLGGVVGVLPITGVVFPFISGGGSSYIVFSAAIGLALNIAATQKKTVAIHPADIIARKDFK
ncbi:MULTISPECIES: FtsW/RodA/SpoVE family cell cycle protein [Leuconostoc]|uniref:Probable peptidoglycan glycosyltransferase FtsW n=2 Tax=Leuconostoc kimchii TaxID=136609 RepID=D5T1B0_LEUKI|nr:MULTISPECIES: FtsW/RodA/SpoVE family cell cycle protein [Leuconostoc]ADG40059.1 cell division protein FtsW [Leuconostoc kimchii IMSNU 11154]AEJ30143.1 cell division protein FtsW [Leuconostoc sp. C2]QBR47232.1 FtsW/RodA/SpoVE family cell cycle protein [Leuconostoc kimchii]